MTALAIGLILASAVLHAGWNLASKREKPDAAYFLVANTAGALVLTPLVLARTDLLRSFPPVVWLWLLVTGLFMALYYGGLAAAYRHGHLSVVYPLARAIPVVLVSSIGVLLGRAGAVTATAYLGIVLVVGGLLLLPRKFFAGWNSREYLAGSCAFAVLAAVGTTGYTLIDDHALRLIRQSVQDEPLVLPLVYQTLEGWLASGWLLVWLLGVDRKPRKSIVKRMKLRNGFTGVAIFGGYGPVLIAMAFVADVSYIAAFRQAGVFLGFLAGLVWLKEPRHPVKMAGAGVLFLGLVLVALG